MALPLPRNKEKKSNFLNRCISEVSKDPKFKDNKQRVAICYTQFDEAKASARVTVGEGDEEFLVLAEEHMVNMNAPEMEDESPEEELEENKSDLYEMAVGSVRSIQAHAAAILASLEDVKVQDNLTETWMQGKLAISEDYIVTVHNYVMFNRED
jgi:hypothetical protein